MMILLIEMGMTGVRTSFRGLESRVKFEKTIRHSSRNDMDDLGVQKRSQTRQSNLRFIGTLMVFLYHNHTTNDHQINVIFVVSTLDSVQMTKCIF